MTKDEQIRHNAKLVRELSQENDRLREQIVKLTKRIREYEQNDGNT